MEKSKQNTDEYYDIPQVCALLHISRRTAYRWIQEERLQGRRVCRKWLFTREDIEKALK